MHLVTLVFSFAVAAVTSLQAQEITAPTGDAILTITGGIAVTNVGETLVFDLDSLMALPSEIVETETIWTTDIQKFKGVSLVTLATLIGADAGELLATAINDYTVSIPISDAIEGGPIIAYMLNDQEMRVIVAQFRTNRGICCGCLNKALDRTAIKAFALETETRDAN